MKRCNFIYWIVIICCIVVSCSKYDDSGLKSEIGRLQEKVSSIERLCKDYNDDLSAIRSLVQAAEGRDYIKNVEELPDSDGYRITFTSGKTVEIHDGEDAIGAAPIVGVKKDSDGCYYWTMDGKFIERDGHRFKVEGEDGKNGCSPKVKIENDFWYVSYDDGASWNKLDSITSYAGSSSFVQFVKETGDAFEFRLPDGSVLSIKKQNAQSISITIKSRGAWLETQRRLDYTFIKRRIVADYEVFPHEYAKYLADNFSSLSMRLTGVSGEECFGNPVLTIVAATAGDDGMLEVVVDDTEYSISLLLSDYGEFDDYGKFISNKASSANCILIAKTEGSIVVSDLVELSWRVIISDVSIDEVNDGKLCWAARNVGETRENRECGKYTWAEAQTVCPAGWRLPTKEEFECIEAHCWYYYRTFDDWNSVYARPWWGSGSGHNPAVFFTSSCWSSTESSDEDAYCMNNYSASLPKVTTINKNAQLAVRCVRERDECVPLSGTIIIDGKEWQKYNSGATTYKPEGEFYSASELDKACPPGYRVPTVKELEDLMSNGSVWQADSDAGTGRWFSGKKRYFDSSKAVFLPAAGYRYSNSELSKDNGIVGYYYTSDVEDKYRSYVKFQNLTFTEGFMYDHPYWDDTKYSVRCVK